MNSPSLRSRALRAASSLALASLWLGAGAASAAGITVLIADDSALHAEFAGQLRNTAEPGHAVELRRLAPGAVAPRGAAGATAPTDVEATIAVGQTAARAALERTGGETLVLAMLSRLDYETLRVLPSFRRADRRVGVLLRDPAMIDQLALIDAVLPKKRRLGVVTTADSEPLVRELQLAAVGWDLQVQYAPNASSLALALRRVVARSDALMVLPDRIGDNPAATLAVLRAGAEAGLPVFGASDGLVRSGGLAAAVSTPAQLAQQARAIVQKLNAVAARSDALIEAATPPTVRVNATVARALGLRLPDERVLTERITVTR